MSRRPVIHIIFITHILNTYEAAVLKTLQIAFFIVENLVYIHTVEISIKIKRFVSGGQVQATVEFRQWAAKACHVVGIHMTITIDISKVSVASLCNRLLVIRESRIFSSRSCIQSIDLRLRLEYAQ